MWLHIIFAVGFIFWLENLFRCRCKSCEDAKKPSPPVVPLAKKEPAEAKTKKKTWLSHLGFALLCNLPGLFGL